MRLASARAGILPGPMPEKVEVLEVAGREVRVTNPGKVFFPALGLTKLDLVRYWLSVAPGALTGCRTGRRC